MKSVSTFLIACFLAAIPALVDAETGFLDRTIVVNGGTYRYQVYVPRDWGASRSWPVVICLHGNGSQGFDGSKQMASAGASALVSAIQVDRSRMPAVVVFPQAAPDTNWGFPVMQEMVSKQLDAVIAEFNGDVDRIYLWGHSMGGGGVLRLAARWPERFAAAVESAGWPTVSRNISQARADEDRTANPFLSASDPYAALAGIITRLPIWVFHSDADSTVPVEQSRMLVSALRAAGAEVRYTEYSGLTHNETGAKVPTEADLAPWLLGQKRLTAAR